MRKSHRRQNQRAATAKNRPANPEGRIPRAQPVPTGRGTPQPINPLVTFILACITPILAIAGLTAEQATQGAIQALDAQPGSVLQAGQVVAFTLASLDSLRLSASQDLSDPLKLKFRGNASGLNRIAARHAASAIAFAAEPPPAPAPPRPAEAEADLKSLIQQTESLLQKAAPPTDAKRDSDLKWASNLISAAADHLHELQTLPAHQTPDHATRIVTICGAAHEIITGEKRYPEG